MSGLTSALTCMRILLSRRWKQCCVATVETMKTQRLAKSAAVGTMIIAFALTGCSNSDSDADQDSETQETESQDQASETGEAQNESDDDESGEDDAERSESEDATKSDSSGLPEDADLSKETPSVTPEDAIATAKKEAKDGLVHAIELDFDERDGAWQYEVKIIDGSTDFDVEIDAESGEAVDVEKDTTDDKEKAIDLKDPMTYDEALELAQDKASGRLDGWKLESDDDRIEYQFDFDDGGEEIEVSVDVESERVSVDD